MSSTQQGEKNIAVKSAKASSSSRLMVAGVVIFVIVAAAVAIPVGIIYGRRSGNKPSPPTASPPTASPPPSPPPSYSVQVAFTASGDVSDYDSATKDLILSKLATAAGFATVPTDAALSVTSASVRFVANFPVSDSTALASAKTSLHNAMSDQQTAQTFLRTAVPSIIIESAPSVDAMDGTTYPPPPPFPLIGHWLSAYGSAMTYTSDHVVTISSWSKQVTPITQHSDSYYIIQKPASDTYNPKKFQKVFYHTNGDGTMSTCTSLTDAATEDEAIAHSGDGIYYANSTQCGSFSHTSMSPYTIPVAGTWNVGGAVHTINNDMWKSNATWGVTVRTIAAFSPTMAIAQMPADDSYNPSKWVKIEWHDKTASSFSFCSTTYDSATLLDALNHDSVGLGHYNVSDAKGCGASGFSHSDAILVARRL